MKKVIFILLASYLFTVVPINACASDDTWISETAKNACVEYGEQYGICPEPLMAIVETESCGEKYALNKGCKGLMQISTRWHYDRMDRLGVIKIWDEESNILVGADYIAEFSDMYGDIAYVLDVYNGNSKAEYNYENCIVSEYAGKILERSAELERLHGK